MTDHVCDPSYSGGLRVEGSLGNVTKTLSQSQNINEKAWVPGSSGRVLLKISKQHLQPCLWTHCRGELENVIKLFSEIIMFHR
jgi:predicted amino acid racemase